MDFRLNDEQLALQEAAKDFLSKECTSSVVRDAFEGPDGDARELYAHMAELGWLGVTVPEDKGGLGLGLVEQAVICEQLGYFNAPGPYFSTACVTIPLLLTLGVDDLLAPLVDGSTRASAPAANHLDLSVDAQIVDALCVVGSDGATWYERDAFEVTPHESIDGTRRFNAVRLTGAGRSLGKADFHPTQDAARALLCAEMVGGMQWALDDTVEYVKNRQQFGVPIGTFQAVKHRLADMLLQTESARSAAYYAAYANASDEPDAAYATSVAKAYCSDAAVFVTGEGIQLHGGIGFTWEHDMHLYFKRARTNEVLLGDAAYHRERVLQLDPEAVTA
jgi:alkylation response protein AidB-like acyl-CoA dehydrogenase